MTAVLVFMTYAAIFTFNTFRLYGSKNISALKFLALPDSTSIHFPFPFSKSKTILSLPSFFLKFKSFS